MSETQLCLYFIAVASLHLIDLCIFCSFHHFTSKRCHRPFHILFQGWEWRCMLVKLLTQKDEVAHSRRIWEFLERVNQVKKVHKFQVLSLSLLLNFVVVRNYWYNLPARPSYAASSKGLTLRLDHAHNIRTPSYYRYLTIWLSSISSYTPNYPFWLGIYLLLLVTYPQEVPLLFILRRRIGRGVLGALVKLWLLTRT